MMHEVEPGDLERSDKPKNPQGRLGGTDAAFIPHITGSTNEAGP